MPKRDFDSLISDAVASLYTSKTVKITEVVCGGARGADEWGKQWAGNLDIPIKMFLADWDKYGKAAGPIRNQQMGDYADALIVFIYNNSRGSQNMLDYMIKLGKPTYVVYNNV